MPDGIVKSSIRITLISGAILTAYLLFFSVRPAISVAFGVVFSLSNIYLLWKLIVEINVVTNKKINAGRVFLLIILKFGLLWGALAVAVYFKVVDGIWVLVGFSVLLFVFSATGFADWMREVTSSGNH